MHRLVRSVAILLALGLQTQTSGAAGARSTATTRRGTAAKKIAVHRPAKGHFRATFPVDYELAPAYRYAQLEPGACYEELQKRELPAERQEPTWPGLSAPVRLKGALNGVTFRTDILERESSPYELFDCRLVLALHDFTRLLRAEGVHEVVMSSAYRPPPKSIELGMQGKRHSGGLAIDMHRFQLDDGRTIKVDRDFHGRIGAPVCGRSAPRPFPDSEDARLLRRLACGAAEQRLFQSILTPNFDRPHHNHFHVELTLGVRWFSIS